MGAGLVGAGIEPVGNGPVDTGARGSCPVGVGPVEIEPTGIGPVGIEAAGAGVAGTPSDAEDARVVGGALADADRKRIESLAEQGITVEKLETQVRVEEVVACTDSLIRARATLTQTALRACANGTCTDASAQPAQEVVLDIERASGLVVAAQGASGQSGADGR